MERDVIRLDGKDLANAVTMSLDVMGFDNKAFAEGITSGHRTLQQKAFRAFLNCIWEWAKRKETGEYDERNRVTVEISKKIVDVVGDVGIPFI
jgi:hypothetical protein